MMDFDQIDAALARGDVTERDWYARLRELLENAYLATDDPQQQSGLGGDAAHWERRRRVIVEAIDHDGSFLDIGCANGLLMETLTLWAQERGVHLVPYGLDISAQLAALARTRLPHWGHQIFVGNAFDWEPPQRFDFVRTEVVYVPVSRQREYIARLLAHVVSPGGRLIVCSYRSQGERDAEPVRERLQGWGFAVIGEANAIDALSGGIATRVIWMDAAS